MVEYHGSPLSPARRVVVANPSNIGRLALVAAVGLVVANCSNAQKVASSRGGIDPKYGVAPSPKVVADGEAVPKGGGREMVGKPYVVAGRLYTPREMPNYSAVGTASWYGPSFHGRMTANGEVFDKMSISAAHPTMPLPSYIRVTNLNNGHSIIARVNDRGPYHGNRLVDVSQRVAEALRFRHLGTARVRVDYVSRASTVGSDDDRLYATLRTDGMPAQLVGGPTMVASATPAPAQAATPRVVEPSSGGLTIASLVGRTVAPDPEPVRASSPSMAQAAPVAATPIVGRPAPGIPLPPDRPFDLGTVSAPAHGVVPLPPSRTAARPTRTAGLYFAEPEAGVASRFGSDPMGGLIAQSFVPLKAARADH